MAKLFISLGLVAVLLCGNILAQDKGLGLGIILGEPTGISGKKWLGEDRAIDGTVAWSSGDNSGLHLHADYLFHKFDLIKVEKGKIPLYYGIGGRIKLGDDTNVGVRVPVGLEYLFASAPVDIFLELVPRLDLVPDTEFGIDGGLGARYFFK